MKIKNGIGEINVSPKMVAMLAANVTESCYGVVGMAARSRTDGIVDLLLGENKTKGIKVTTDSNKATVELHIIVQFGLNISSICKSIANRVRYTLETVSGIPVKAVNIRVEGIRVSE